MTAKRVGIALLALLVMLAPLATAHAEDSGNADGSVDRPDDAAWVEDCPPDMMCALDAEGNETRGPEDCEFCRYHQDEYCIDCMGPSTPVDDKAWGTDCPPGVWCMLDGDGPAEPPVCEGGLCEYDAEPAGEESAVEEASLAVVAVAGLLAVLALVFVAALRRQ